VEVVGIDHGIIPVPVSGVVFYFVPDNFSRRIIEPGRGLRSDGKDFPLPSGRVDPDKGRRMTVPPSKADDGLAIQGMRVEVIRFYILVPVVQRGVAYRFQLDPFVFPPLAERRG